MTLAPGTWPMLVDAAWRVTVLLAAAWVVVSLLRRQPAAVRHAVWAVALVAALAVPVAAWLLPAWRLPVLPAEAALLPGPRPDTAPSRPVTHASTLEGAAPGLDDAALLDMDAALSATAETPATASPGVAATTVDWLGLLWVSVAAIVLGRFAASVASVRWLLRDAEPVDDARWRDAADIAAAELGLRETPRLFASAGIAVPFTAGVLRPVVVVPSLALRHWTDQRIRIVLLHELAHVSRRDCLMQALTQLACALYWFNPLTWVAVRRLRAERERACDDMVLSAGLRGAEYAQHLLDIARAATTRRALSAAALAMARPSELEGRLLAILDSREVAGLRASGASWRGVAVAACAVVALASVQPVAREGVPAPEASAGEVPYEAGLATPDAPAPPTEGRQAPPTPVPTPAPAPTPAPSPAPTSRAVVSTDVARAAGIVAGQMAGRVAESAVTVATSLAVAVAEGVADGVIDGMQVAVSGTPKAPGAEPVRGRTVSPAVIQGLTEAMKDTDPDVRKQALQALTRLGVPVAFDTLVAAVADPDEDLRAYAVFALGRSRDPRAVAPLTSALRDKEADVREQAVFALSQMGDRSAIPAILGVLAGDKSADVREQAAFALSQIGDDSAVAGLTAALKDESADVRRQAVFALSQIASGDVRPRRRQAVLAPVAPATPVAPPNPATAPPAAAPQAPR